MAVATAALMVDWRSLSLGQEQVPAPVPLPNTALTANDRYLGVGSCASPACHGGSDSAENEKQRGKWNSAYTVWVQRDRHAKAFAVLYSAESKKILRNLDHLELGADPAPHRDERCLACHSASVPNQSAVHGNASLEGRAFAADGVGCEACHGAARGWLAEHTARTWSKTDAATHRDTHGSSADADGRMVNTRDMTVRAGVCVDCHVGSPRADGLPGRNMDHDMIAAGHPRLTFEMSAFLANMPRHWDDRGEKSREDYAAHVWAVGQFATTQAALRLLAARAKAAEMSPETARWPELSEYDCYTCHHRLSLDSYRQKALDGAGHKAGKDKGSRKLGRFVWGTWYLPMTRLLAAERGAGASGLASVDRVVKLMEDPNPRPSDVRAAAAAAAQAMQKALEGASKDHYQRDCVDRMLLAAVNRPAANWDEACGEYLLFRAACAKDPRFTEPLAALRELLQFRDKPQANGPPIQYNSPFDFVPAAFNNKINELRGLLPRQ